MSSPSPLLNNGDSVHTQNQDALVTVLGVCLLIIGLCAFTGLILLFQQLQRARPASDLGPPPPVLTRRTAKPIAVTTQFRPLSETLRHRGGELTRQLSATSLERASAAHNAQAAPLLAVAPPLPGACEPLPLPPLVARTSSGSLTPTALTLSAPPAAPPVTSGPQAAVAAGPSDVVAARDAAAGGVTAGSGSMLSAVGGCAPKAASRPIDEIDISLLSRVEEALASGYMRPHQATQLLKSYGCDLEELLRVELSDSSVEGGRGDKVPAERLASAPILGSRSQAAAASAAATAPAAALAAAAEAAVATPAAAAAAAGVSSLSARVPRQLRPPQVAQTAASPSQPEPTVPSPPPPPTTTTATAAPASMLNKEGSGASLSSLLLSGGAGGGGGTANGGTPSGGGAVIDDALLLKLDLALASGCVRPEQATQLLKSYGCDLEELLREEVGEAALGPSRNASSGLSGSEKERP